MNRFYVSVWLAVLFAVGLSAAEPWADERLPKLSQKGLILWLDASAQNRARMALGQTSLESQSPLGAWYDSSGRQRHLRQDKTESQPRIQIAKSVTTIRFDGVNDHIALPDDRLELRNLTLIIVAAPFSNAGEFRALFAGNEPGKNDYMSGVNVDFGPFFSGNWSTVNVEGPGFGGAINLLKSPVEFGALHRSITRVTPSEVEHCFDGVVSGARKRTTNVLRLDHLVVGARTYSNESRPPYVRGFLDGDIAEILLFDHALDDKQLRDVDQYLAKKYENVVLEPPQRNRTAGSVPLVPVKNPPPVQMLVPGFHVREIPLDLPNINNVRYRSDGKLLALGYNGNLYLLSDTNKDGLEDKIELFFESNGRIQSPIGLALTPPEYHLGNGAFVACRGKVVLIVDTNSDDRADKVMVVADGWKELPHGVDALGVAVAKDGGVYFGLGTTDYTNAYQVGADGKAAYDLRSERGTIMRVSPDFKKREIVATGIRFPVGMALNAVGDLFATDQEGATWLPNGNPLDELLHIQKGRHYGFPPRHPKHLPNVIDEPSTFDYGPQYQSTCGLTFIDDGFGPKSWAGDALVTGYSRGKLYRTEIQKTDAGYVACNHLIACLNMLTVDACTSSGGALVVACHSGMPDWGTGPIGQGTLYKITYEDRTAPQPVAAWSQSPTEMRIAFDRPLNPAHVAGVTRQAKIEYGAAVRAGDRFESLRPGYAVVQQQIHTPRFPLEVLSSGLTPDRRTLVLTTRPTRHAAHYAVTLPGNREPKEHMDRAAQHPELDLELDLCGVAAEWQSQDGKETWTGWLPHLDLNVARRFTAGSADHDRFWSLVQTPGRLSLRTKLDLRSMLRPAVQPGSKLDYSLPEEKVRVRFESRHNLIGKPDLAKHVSVFEISRTGKADALESVEIAVYTTDSQPDLSVTWYTNEDERKRPLPLHRQLLPWANVTPPDATSVQMESPELSGGNYARGKALFFGDVAQCSKCHRVNGQGGDAGPDLSNLIHRDYQSVLRDIRTPSAAINPDHLTYLIELTDGRSLSGVVKQERGQIRIIDAAGKQTVVVAANVESMTPASVSTMPEGLDKLLGPEKLRDLLTFLLTEPLPAAKLEIPGAPPSRKRSEIEAVLRASPAPTGPFRKVHVVLCTGPKDHGPGEHDYPLWRRRWVKLLDLDENVRVSEAERWPSAAQLAAADLIVFYSNNPAWDAERAKELDAFLCRGGGAVFIHYAVDGHKHVNELAALIGLAWRGGASKFRHGPLAMNVFDRKDPITLGLEKLQLTDESYWNLAGDARTIHTLAANVEDNSSQPLIWTREHGKGRVFVSIPGHYNWSFDDPLFRLVLLRGMAWTMREPVDRFRPLIWPGARLAITD